MAGLTDKGLEIRYLPEVLEQYHNRAQDIFSDEVEPGDVVDTSENSALGRMIGVVAPSVAELWEALQEVHDSFNPNVATGYALDNEVALSGIIRYAEEPTRAQVVFEGNYNIVVSSVGSVSSSVTLRQFRVITPVLMNLQQASGVAWRVTAVEAGHEYKIGYSTDGGSNFVYATYTATATDTAASIQTMLGQRVSQSWTSFETQTDAKNNYNWARRRNRLQIVHFDLDPRITPIKVAKPGVVEDTQMGPSTQLPGTIDTISVPILGWDSVYNPTNAVSGRFRETDVELRERWRNSKFYQAAAILEAMLDGMHQVPGVRDVTIIENDTNNHDSVHNVPPHAFTVITHGGDDSDIGKMIWQKKPTGIQAYGDTVVQIADSQGKVHSIGFRRAEELEVQVNLNISAIAGQVLPGDVKEQVTAAILAYQDGLDKIGKEVVYSRLYTPINSVPGFQVNSLTIGKKGGTQAMANIPVGYDEVAIFDATRIAITVT
ncbi:putative baseplate protein [Pseudomonas phage vB_PaeM_PAO1_Ab17]|uniref:Baseplate protein J-like domain-containing protein n=2 Tax=Nankokuvirus Ab03 TaxID=1925780 RepID=A0A0A1IW44_9CAUD|nr:baseplate wedge subunit [Pseudomonas phage vB_PaeM_PAO1_Ab03]CEF89184.1 hypothetical protein [Pseudomonas phage vB_PaeM_PAO1_Ab03]CEF89568.1 putative baseplate protein [Pseudomonas phage vB_PaeM_PAO1_Ab17]